MSKLVFEVSDSCEPMTYSKTSGHIYDQQGIAWFIGHGWPTEQPKEEKSGCINESTLLKLSAILSDTEAGKQYLKKDE